MKTNKKMISLLLIMVMTIAFSLPVSAAQVTNNGESQGTTLSYSVSQVFIVTIPSTVTIDASGEGTETVSVSNAVIPYGKSVKVTITEAANYSDSKFRLKDGENANYLNYTIKIGGNSISKGNPFLSVPAGTATGSAELAIKADTPTKSGMYTDSLTFTVTIE